MNIDANGLVCIGLNKKARLILHDEYPIMAYYNPILLDDIPIKSLYVRTRYYLYAFKFD
jgi:Ni,Fe-hydrogenase III component G